MTNFSKSTLSWILLTLLGAASAWSQTAPTVQWQTSVPEFPVAKPASLAKIVQVPNGEYQTIVTSQPLPFNGRAFSTFIQLLPTGQFKTAQALPAFPITYTALDLVNTQDGGTLISGLCSEQSRFFMRKLNAQGNEIWTWLSGDFSFPGTFPQPNYSYEKVFAIELPSAYMITGSFSYQQSRYGFRFFIDKNSGAKINYTYGPIENALRAGGRTNVLDACMGVDGGMLLATEFGLRKIGSNDEIEWTTNGSRVSAVVPSTVRNGYFSASWSPADPFIQFQIEKIAPNGAVVWSKRLVDVPLGSAAELIAEPDGGVVMASIIGDKLGLRKFDANGNQVWQTASVNGKLTSLAKTADGGYTIGTISQSISSPFFIFENNTYPNNEAVFVKFSPEQSSSTPTAFAVTAPTYNCNSGQLLINTSGGNGAVVEYRIAGLGDWSGSNIFNVPPFQRNGTTFTLEARQSGNVTSLAFTATACGTTPPVVTPPVTPPVAPPVTPPTGTFAVLAPGYDCNTGQLTAQVANAGGATVEYRIIGLRDWASSPTFSVPSYQRTGTTFKVEARTSSGAYASTDFATACGSTPPPVTPPINPPTGTPLNFGANSFDCGSGLLRLTTSGGDGSGVEFRVPGLRDWSSSTEFIIPTYQRQSTYFSLYARQSGREIMAQFLTNCPATARVASSETGANWQVSVLGNPVEDQVQVRLSGLAGQRVGLSISDATGRVFSERQVSVQTEGQTETISVRGSAGVYLVRVQNNGQQQTLKVVKK